MCMRCAGLDHLEYLPAGHGALTRRAHRASDRAAALAHAREQPGADPD